MKIHTAWVSWILEKSLRLQRLELRKILRLPATPSILFSKSCSHRWNSALFFAIGFVTIKAFPYKIHQLSTWSIFGFILKKLKKRSSKRRIVKMFLLVMDFWEGWTFTKSKSLSSRGMYSWDCKRGTITTECPLSKKARVKYDIRMYVL